jgi:protein-tyrosine phosphatase
VPPGLTNFRDLGGHRTDDGLTVRPGLLYRSDHLSPTVELTSWVRSNTRTVFDLRTSMEQDRMGRYVGTDLATATRVIERPILDGAMIQERARAGNLDLAAMYQAIAFEHADEIADVVTLIADPANLPALVTCTAGKDRTGVVAAVVLRALGVPAEDVLADYERSAAAADGLRERIVGRLTGVDLSKVPAAAFAVDRAALEAVLDGIDERFDDVGDYLAAAGAPAYITERLRAALVA